MKKLILILMFLSTILFADIRDDIDWDNMFYVEYRESQEWPTDIHMTVAIDIENNTITSEDGTERFEIINDFYVWFGDNKFYISPLSSGGFVLYVEEEYKEQTKYDFVIFLTPIKG